MEKIKVYYVESKWQEEALLGRKVKDYALLNLAKFDSETVQSIDEAEKAFKEGVLNIVLPLACPLVTEEDVLRLAKSMRLRGASRVEFYTSSAVFCRGRGGGERIFVNNSAFFEISDANSYCLVYNILRNKIIDRHLSNGVLVFDRENTHVDDTVQVVAGAKILPFCRIQGSTRIESGAEVSASVLIDSFVGEDASVECSHVSGSEIGKRTTVGPFARLRGAKIGDGCRIGDFVEVKQSTVGNGTKSAHLTYIGDATVGERTNIGCGTVFCNYDGKQKHKTNVGNDCFVGANTNLIAPIKIGDRAFIAAGTTVTKDVANDSFAIARTEQKTKFINTKQQD
ncbi:MAG: hypothetical protein IJ226_00930 [Clostridia bacterium]|nr:hypothetical protein [Clostridia bacterium]